MKKLFLAIVSLIQKVRLPNWTILKKDSDSIHYIYNGKRYIYVGDKLPTEVTRGFFIPVKQILWNGQDVTKHFLKYAGPRQDFFGERIPLEHIFYTVTSVKWVATPVFSVDTRVKAGISFKKVVHKEPESGVLEIINVFNQSKSVESG